MTRSESPRPADDNPENAPMPIGPVVDQLVALYRLGLSGEPAASPLDPGRPESPPSLREQSEAFTHIELADIVRLRRPYAVRSKLYGQQGTVFTHGIVVEILSRLPDGRTRTVSLYLFNPETRQVYMGPNEIPEFVDHVCSEVTLWKRATEMGYLPTDPTGP